MRGQTGCAASVEAAATKPRAALLALPALTQAPAPRQRTEEPADFGRSSRALGSLLSASWGRQRASVGCPLVETRPSAAQRNELRSSKFELRTEPTSRRAHKRRSRDCEWRAASCERILRRLAKAQKLAYFGPTKTNQPTLLQLQEHVTWLLGSGQQNTVSPTFSRPLSSHPVSVVVTLSRHSTQTFFPIKAQDNGSEQFWQPQDTSDLLASCRSRAQTDTSEACRHSLEAPRVAQNCRPSSGFRS